MNGNPQNYACDQGVIDRILGRVEPDLNGGCWLWSGALDVGGYGKIGVSEGRGKKRVLATHRVMFVAKNGDPGGGLDLDHLCRVRSCCNPAHLEAVPRRENLMRGMTIVASYAASTECPSGHPRSAENTYITPGSGHRQCQPCRDRRAVEFGERQKAKRHARGLKPKRNQWTGPWVAEPV